MKRPPISKLRVEGLAMLAEHMRPLANVRAGDEALFRLPREQAAKVRAAIKYVDDLVRWQKERGT